jgi:hypothetical protein
MSGGAGLRNRPRFSQANCGRPGLLSAQGIPVCPKEGSAPGGGGPLHNPRLRLGKLHDLLTHAGRPISVTSPSKICCPPALALFSFHDPFGGGSSLTIALAHPSRGYLA